MNLISIAIGLIVLVLFIAAVGFVISDCRKGKGSCGNSCGSCPSGAFCQKKDRDPEG